MKSSREKMRFKMFLVYFVSLLWAIVCDQNMKLFLFLSKNDEKIQNQSPYCDDNGAYTQ